MSSLLDEMKIQFATRMNRVEITNVKNISGLMSGPSAGIRGFSFFFFKKKRPPWRWNSFNKLFEG